MKPKNKKFNKYHSPKLKHNFKLNNKLEFSGIIAIQNSFINSSQLESCILTIKRLLKKKGKIILKVFPHSSITKKPSETRMGSGKGNVFEWCCTVSVGTPILEINSSNKLLVKNALLLISKKLPFKTKLILI